MFKRRPVSGLHEFHLHAETVAEGNHATGSVLVRQFALAEVLGEDAEALKGTLSLWEMTLAVTPPDFHSTVNSARIQGGVSF